MMSAIGFTNDLRALEVLTGQPSYKNGRLDLDEKYRKPVQIFAVTGVTTSNREILIRNGFHFLRNLPELFTSADLEGKHRFLGSTFPQKMFFCKRRSSNQRSTPNSNA